MADSKTPPLPMKSEEPKSAKLRLKAMPSSEEPKSEKLRLKAAPGSAESAEAGSGGTANVDSGKKSSPTAHAPTTSEEDEEYDEDEEDGQVDSMVMESGYVAPKFVVSPHDMPVSHAPTTAEPVGQGTPVKVSVAVTQDELVSSMQLKKKDLPMRKKGKKGKRKGKKLKSLPIGGKLHLTAEAKGKRSSPQVDTTAQRAMHRRLVIYGVMIAVFLVLFVVIILVAAVLGSSKGSKGSPRKSG